MFGKPKNKSKYPSWLYIYFDDVRGILLSALLLLMFLGVIGYLSSKYTLNPFDEPRVPAAKLSLYKPLLDFHQKWNRWPKDKTELKKSMDQYKMDPNLVFYQKLEFKTEKDGSLTVDYIFKALSGTEQGIFNFP